MKGFSSPGSSDSVSTQSFTQFFKATSQTPDGGAPPAEPSSSSRYAASDTQMSAVPPWRKTLEDRPPDETRFPVNDSPGVTSLINSLSSSAERDAEKPMAYRPEPIASPYTSNSADAGRSDIEAGGVTRILQRLSQELPARATPLTTVKPAQVPSSDPGEATRTIELPGAKSAASVPAAPHVPVQAAPSPMPVISQPVVPPMPVPPSPIASALPVPVVPKPPAPAAPIAAAPKSKLDAMVPILLVINTFLLLVLLLAVVFLITKTR
jgi:hypothetical protein